MTPKQKLTLYAIDHLQMILWDLFDEEDIWSQEDFEVENKKYAFNFWVTDTKLIHVDAYEVINNVEDTKNPIHLFKMEVTNV